MTWVRSNIRRGSHIALFALAIQFVLSFGHFHAIPTAAAAPSIQASSQQLPARGHDSDRHPDDFCAICAVMALASTAVAAAPPALPIPQALEFEHPPIDATFVPPRPARAAFRSRAPPLS
jgi:hypothetical protein